MKRNHTAGFGLIGLLLTVAVVGLILVWLYGGEKYQAAVDARRETNEQVRTQAQLEAEAVVEVLNNL